MLSLTDFFSAASRRHNDIILLPALPQQYAVSGNDFVPAGQCTSTPRRERAIVEKRQETRNFLAPNLWPSNSPDLSPVDYEIWAVMPDMAMGWVHSWFGLMGWGQWVGSEIFAYEMGWVGFSCQK